MILHPAWRSLGKPEIKNRALVIGHRGIGNWAQVIPIQKMLATDNPTRPIGHPPRLRGGLGRGFINVSYSFFKLV
jgi:hypothetical protein